MSEKDIDDEKLIAIAEEYLDELSEEDAKWIEEYGASEEEIIELRKEDKIIEILKQNKELKEEEIEERVIKGLTKSDTDSVIQVKGHKKLSFYIYDEDFEKWARIDGSMDGYVLEDFDQDIRISYDCI